MATPSARLGLEVPDGATDSADGPLTFGQFAAILDAAAIIDRGSLASRPTSSPGTPGIVGRAYIVSDQGNRLDLDYGTGWVTIGEIADGAITLAKLAAALKPSGSAAAGDEALRAVGSGAGNVVAGNDARLTNERTPPDGSVTLAKLHSALAALIGDRDKAIIPDEQSRTNAAYGKLATPDEVSITVPADGLLVITYDALWESSVASAGRAAIFIDANQAKIGDNTVPVVQEAATGGTGVQRVLSSAGGLHAAIGTSNVTTGQILGRVAPVVGGACYIEDLPAGTYTVSIQFKASSGSVTAKERKLRCWTEGF